MSVKEMFKRMFLPGYNERKVQEINNESLRKIEESGRAAKKLNREGLANLIIIAIGGPRHD